MGPTSGWAIAMGGGCRWPWTRSRTSTRRLTISNHDRPAGTAGGAREESTMSTRCQIGFYETPTQALDQPSALLYRHSDGYPDGTHGVLAALLPWAEDFAARRGLADTEYATARALVALIRQQGLLDEVLSYGVCGDLALHGDIEYFYRVDPAAITVYDARNAEWGSFREHSRHVLPQYPPRH